VAEGACVVLLIGEPIGSDPGIEVVPRTGVSRIKAMGIMDTWKRGRIIYAYLIWVVFKATTAGGLYGEYANVSFHPNSVSRGKIRNPQPQYLAHTPSRPPPVRASPGEESRHPRVTRLHGHSLKSPS